MGIQPKNENKQIAGTGRCLLPMDSHWVRITIVGIQISSGFATMKMRCAR